VSEAAAPRSWRGAVWRWGVVTPCVVAAAAGAIADVVPGTLRFWYLLAPSYAAIAITVWRGMGTRPTAALALEPAPVEAPVLIEEPLRVSVGSLAEGLAQGALRLLATLVVSFIYLVAIWAAIAAATWARPYWYVYIPAAVVIAGLVWLAAWSGRDRRHDHPPPGAIG